MDEYERHPEPYNHTGKGLLQRECNETIMLSSKPATYEHNSSFKQILEQIFPFLSTKELANVGLVCKKWKSESDRILKLRSPLIVLKTETDIKCITAVMDKRKTLGSTPLFRNFMIVLKEIHLEQKKSGRAS